MTARSVVAAPTGGRQARRKGIAACLGRWAAHWRWARPRCPDARPQRALPLLRRTQFAASERMSISRSVCADGGNGGGGVAQGDEGALNRKEGYSNTFSMTKGIRETRREPSWIDAAWLPLRLVQVGRLSGFGCPRLKPYSLLSPICQY